MNVQRRNRQEDNSPSDAEYLANTIASEIKEFLALHPHRQVAVLRQCLPDDSPLRKPLYDLHELLFKKQSKDDSYFNERLSRTVRSKKYVNAIVGCFHLIVAKIYLDPADSPIGEFFVTKALEKSKLSSKEVKGRINTQLDTLIHGEAKRGRPTTWTEEKLTELLACYNRYLVVIRSARREVERLRRKLEKERSVARPQRAARIKVAEKYHIPKRHHDTLWNLRTSPSDVALAWIYKDSSRSNKSDEESPQYLRNLLKKAKRQWNATEQDKDQVLIDTRHGALIVFYKKDLKLGNPLHFKGFFD